MDLFDGNRVAAYFLWEYTHCPNALHLWLCAEDTAIFLKRHNITAARDIEEILRLGQHDAEYIGFMRHIAYRVFKFTGTDDAAANWYSAERLIHNGEWRGAITFMARNLPDEVKASIQ
jgi:hypothetical protein